MWDRPLTDDFYVKPKIQQSSKHKTSPFNRLASTIGVLTMLVRAFGRIPSWCKLPRPVMHSKTNKIKRRVSLMMIRILKSKMINFPPSTKKRTHTFSILYSDRALDAISTASCCIWSLISAFLITAFRCSLMMVKLETGARFLYGDGCKLVETGGEDRVDTIVLWSQQQQGSWVQRCCVGVVVVVRCDERWMEWSCEQAQRKQEESKQLTWWDWELHAW